MTTRTAITFANPRRGGIASARLTRGAATLARFRRVLRQLIAAGQDLRNVLPEDLLADFADIVDAEHLTREVVPALLFTARVTRDSLDSTTYVHR